MGLDGRNGREELRRDLAVLLPESDECGDAALCVSQLAVPPWTWACPSQLAFASLDPAIRSETEKDRASFVESPARAPPLAAAPKRLAGDEQRAARVQWETSSLEARRRFLRSGDRYLQAAAREQEQGLATQRPGAGPEVAAVAVLLERAQKLFGSIEVAEPSASARASGSGASPRCVTRIPTGRSPSRRAAKERILAEEGSSHCTSSTAMSTGSS
jgi:hypothetical protein